MLTRVVAGIGVIATGSGIVALNYGAAKIRDLAASGGGLMESMDLSKLAASDASMTPPGLALFALGIVNAGFAWWKGYHISDPVPGLESRDREYLEKLDTLHDVEASVDGMIDSVKSRELVHARNRPVVETAELARLRRADAEFEATRLSHSELDESDLTALTTAIETYRQINLSVRSDNQQPACLTGEVVVDMHRRRSEPLKGVAEILEGVRQTLETRSEDWSGCVDRLSEAVADVKGKRSSIMAAIARREKPEDEVVELRLLREQFIQAVNGKTETSEWSEPWQPA